VESLELSISESQLGEPAQSRGVSFSAAQATDEESIATKRHAERRLVQLRIVRQRDDCATHVEVQRAQRFVGPLIDELHPWKSLGCGKSGSRIDDDDLVAGKRRHRGQRLRHVHRPHQDHSKRGVERLVEKPRSPFGLPEDWSIEAKHHLDVRPLRLVSTLLGLEQTLFTRVEVGDQHDTTLGFDTVEDTSEGFALHSNGST
jgi:hypothetical protein